MNEKKMFIFLLFLAIILIAGFIFFSQNISADTTSAVTFTVKISVCGNDEKEFGEECDGEDFGGSTCQTQGFSGGAISCNPACEMNDSQCNNIPTATPTPTSAVQPGGGGGGGSIAAPTVAQAIFKGKAYPESKIALLKDAQKVAEMPAGPDANFEINISGLSPGSYIFGVSAEDKKGNRSITHTFSISVTAGTATTISGIFIPPTISLDKAEVKKGEALNIFGFGIPQAEIAILINSEKEIVKKTTVQNDGGWLYKFNTLEIDYGDHSAKARAIKDDDISSFSSVLSFKVGTKNTLSIPERAFNKSDLSKDGKTNLIDFSILAYWHKRKNPPADMDLNSDGKIDLKDFSIMAYNWTG
ncbi:MAG: Clostripain-related protein [Parcubacteria group bacterium GW2011_GWC1_43_12]|nr:MAG: Clostripain-related protein [Parcubacteria group bacterium GW2011_GWB1_42_6]KKS92000.1 MAG: Clostripain-related protein [Parcubacteria group bacterium GW2011_GWC1_43_12]